MRELGIYVGMSDQEYFDDPGLGSTDQKDLALDPIEWNYLRRRKQPEDDDETAATLWGSALHSRVLDGEKAFMERYLVAPQKTDFAGLLVTKPDLAARGKRLGLSLPTKLTKEEMIAEVRRRDKTTPIWDEIKADLEKKAEGKSVIEREVADQIDTAAQWMQADNELSKYMTGGTFTAGISELSIFAEIDGVRVRMRIDHLLPDTMIDVKSFRPLPGWTSIPEEQDWVLGCIIKNQNYLLQSASYIHTWIYAKKLFAAGKVFGASPRDMEILTAALGRDDGAMKWMWVLVKNSGAPQSFVRGLNTSGSPFSTAMGEVINGLDHYRSYRRVFGLDRDWIPQHASGAIDDQAIMSRK